MFNRYIAGRHLSKAERLLARGNHHQARIEFDRAVELSPDDPAVHLRYAVFLAETNDLISAVSHVARAVDRRPESAPYRLFYGRILLDFGRLGEARQQFTEAVRLNPTGQLAGDYLALIDIAEGNTEAGLKRMASIGLSQNTGFHARALVVLEKLVRLGPQQVEPKSLEVPDDNYRPRGLLRGWRARGLLSDGIHLLDINRWQEAILRFRRAHALSPELKEAVYQEGVAYFMAGDFMQAERIMSGLVDEGDEPAIYLGAALAEQGRFQDSIKVLEKVVRPTAEYEYYLGLYLLSMDKETEARHHFEVAAAKRYDLVHSTFQRACEIYNVHLEGSKK